MIEPCTKCGHQMRLGAMRITFNRKRGVAHYLAHIGHTSCSAAVEYHCQTLKPYPTPHPCDEMIARWNAAQQGTGNE